MEHTSSPIVTILTPAYNAERFICRCLDSLLAQTYTNLQIIVIDDCSTDSTHLLANDYAQRDSRIIVMQTERNSGASAARNTGLAAAKGEYITEVDADDWLAPDAIEKAMAEAAENTETDFILYHTLLVDEKTGTQSPYPIERTAKHVMTGAEACHLSIGWGIHGWGLCRASIYRRFPCQTDAGLYGDENSTHLQLLHCREVRLSDGKHFYSVNDSSVTHVVNMRRFDILEGRMALRQQLIKLGAQHQTIIRQNKVRWTDFIGVCHLFWLHSSQFSSAERAQIWQRMEKAYSTFRLGELPWQTALKPRYTIMPTLTMFYRQVCLTFLLKKFFS